MSYPHGPKEIMHTGQQLFPEAFEIEVGGSSTALDGLFPGRHAQDRFGIVVSEPFGTLGASLLIQAAIANWFDLRPERRDAKPAYAEIYVFHAGGPYGDHSYFDFWPPRREVFVPAHDPVALLGEINARAITRLAVPDAPGGDLSRLSWGPSTWAEQRSADDRLASCFAYHPTGEVLNADIRIASEDPRVEENPSSSLKLLAATGEVQGHEADPAFLPGWAAPADNYRWVGCVRARRHEIPAEVLERLAAERASVLAATNGVRTETYRRIAISDALEIIAAMD